MIDGTNFCEMGPRIVRRYTQSPVGDTVAAIYLGKSEIGDSNNWDNRSNRIRRNAAPSLMN